MGAEGGEPALVPIDWDLPRAEGEESLSGGSSGEEEGDGATLMTEGAVIGYEFEKIVEQA